MSETACKLARALLRRSAPEFEQNSTVRSRIVMERRGPIAKASGQGNVRWVNSASPLTVSVPCRHLRLTRARSP
jgi:hypothetical protein